MIYDNVFNKLFNPEVHSAPLFLHQLAPTCLAITHQPIEIESLFKPSKDVGSLAV